MLDDFYGKSLNTSVLSPEREMEGNGERGDGWPQWQRRTDPWFGLENGSDHRVTLTVV